MCPSPPRAYPASHLSLIPSLSLIHSSEIRRRASASFSSQVLVHGAPSSSSQDVASVEQRRRVGEAAVLVKKSQLTADEYDGSSCDENFEGVEAGLPEIEAKRSDRTVLVKIHCENRKGALIAALSEVESLGLTIMATADDDFSLSVKDIVRKLNQAFKLSL